MTTETKSCLKVVDIRTWDRHMLIMESKWCPNSKRRGKWVIMTPISDGRVRLCHRLWRRPRRIKTALMSMTDVCHPLIIPTMTFPAKWRQNRQVEVGRRVMPVKLCQRDIYPQNSTRHSVVKTSSARPQYQRKRTSLPHLHQHLLHRHLHLRIPIPLHCRFHPAKRIKMRKSS